MTSIFMGWGRLRRVDSVSVPGVMAMAAAESAHRVRYYYLPGRARTRSSVRVPAVRVPAEDESNAPSACHDVRDRWQPAQWRLGGVGMDSARHSMPYP